MNLEEFEMNIHSYQSLSPQDFIDILSQIAALKKNKVKVQLLSMKQLIAFLTMDNLSDYFNVLFDIYNRYENKDPFFELIILIGNKLETLFNILKKIQFYEFFIVEMKEIAFIVFDYYYQTSHYEKGLQLMQQINLNKLSEQEKRRFIMMKGEIYKNLGSNKLYIKSLQDLFLLGHVDTYDALKSHMSLRDFNATYTFLMANIKITSNTDLYALHSILVKEYDIDNLIKFYPFFTSAMIIEDIEYYKVINLKFAATIYKYYILEVLINDKKIINAPILIKHICDLKKIYKEQDFDAFFKALKSKVDEKIYLSVVNALSFG